MQIQDERVEDMGEKRRYIALSVTTMEALEICFAEQALLFCIEDPLYSLVYRDIRGRREIDDYTILEDREKGIMLFKKVRGSRVFEDENYEPFYLPLSWEDWHS